VQCKIAVTLKMEKGPRRQSLDSAREFLHCVLVEQRAAIEELKASTRELQSILDEFLATRLDVRGLVEQMDVPVVDSAPARPQVPQQASAAQLKREADRVLENAREAIHESIRLRVRSKQLRSALQHCGAKAAGSAQGQQSLSKREKQVLGLIVEGKTSKEIAAELGISFKTAVTHRASIMGKLDVHEIASMVREAIRRGLVSP